METTTREAKAQQFPPGGTPVPISKTEGIIEVFWDPAYEAVSRWTLAPAGVDAELHPDWDRARVVWRPRAAGEVLEFARPFDVDVRGYTRLIVRFRTGEGLRVGIEATVDGKTNVIVKNVPGENFTQEFIGPISGDRLQGMKAVFTSVDGKEKLFELRWVMVDKPGASWDPPVEPFKGLVVDGAVGKFEPGLGLLYSAAEIGEVRRAFASPANATAALVDRELAADHAKTDPASLIRRWALYIGARGRYDRAADASYDFKHDGLSLACVGMLDQCDDYLRLAARHAIVFARMEQWSEGFVDRFPAAKPGVREWRHAAFAPNVAAIQVSLLLDMAWHHLTPAGRAMVQQALREKAIPYLEPCVETGCYTMSCNQGTRFMKGYMLARMATTPDWTDPAFRKEMRQRLADFNLSLDRQTRADGTFTEEGYGQGVIACAALTYHLFSRALGEPIHKLITPRLLGSMRFVLDGEGTIGAHLAALGAGPLGDPSFAPCVAPTPLNAGWNPENHGYGVEHLWFPLSRKAQGKSDCRPFSAYREGGWVYMGGRDPAQARISFESGLWATHGHIWMHKNAVTLDAFGETILLTRQYALYSDSRFGMTARTAAYNTFAPGDRNQDLNPSGNHGAKLIAAEDLGPAAFAVSDVASAWATNVKRALRRVILLRPNVLVVEDTAEFDDDEPGVQSWNSLGAWRSVGVNACEVRVGNAVARLTAITPANIRITTAEDSIHMTSLSEAERARTGNSYREVLVYRSAFVSPAARRHRILTVIEVFKSNEKAPPSAVKVVRDRPMVLEITQGNTTARLADGGATATDMWGWKGEGELLLAVHDGQRVIASHAF
ncbi:MAG: hypothetical protein K8S99_16745 [Planctomycetes bacterium]|nr:hypothetical protein [Planctomycetota bacterium]